MQIRFRSLCLLLIATMCIVGACSAPVPPAPSVDPAPPTAPIDPDPPVITEPDPADDTPVPSAFFKTAQAASIVIGQENFTAGAPHAAPDIGFNEVYGNPLVIDGVLYLPDDKAGRIMGYTAIPTTDGAAADFVLGKADFTGGAVDAEASLGEPGSVFTDGADVFVTDFLLNRILRYDGIPIASGVDAAQVIGQPNFTALEEACSPTRFAGPDGAIIAGGKLIVADSINNRVLIWEEVPTSLDEPATIALGQVDLNTCDFLIGAPANNNFFIPRDVWSDGTRLLVVDGRNNRVLGWNEFPTTHNAPADFVLGQEDFNSNDSGNGSAGLNAPVYIASNGTQVFLSDAGNNRVLIWNEFPTHNGVEADVVLGQPDFDQSKENFGLTATNEFGFHHPTGLFVHDNLLIVGDLNNHRYLVFESE